MKLLELIQQLQAVVERIGGEEEAAEVEVRLMCQPSWPFEYSIENVVYSLDVPEQEEEDTLNKEDVVYLTEGRQLGYGDKKVWDV